MVVDQGQQEKPTALRSSLPQVMMVVVADLASRVEKYVIALSDLQVNP